MKVTSLAFNPISTKLQMKSFLSRDTVFGLTVIAALTGYPLVATITDGLGVSNTPFALAYRITVLVFFITFGFNLRRLRLDCPKDTVAILVLTFFLFYSLRLFYSTLISAETLSHPIEFYWMWAFGGCIVPTSIIMMQRRGIDFLAIQSPITAICFVICILALLSGTMLREDALGEVYSSGRFSLTSLNPISLANVGVTLCILTIWRLWIFPWKLSNGKRLALLISFGLGAYVMLITGSRAPILSLLGSITVMYGALGGGRKLAFLLIFLTVAAIAVLFLLRNADSLDIRTMQRVSSIGSDFDISGQARLESFQSALLDAIDNPLFGAQIEERITGWYPHNLFIESLMATGLIAGSMFILATFLILFMAVASVTARRSYSWISLIFIQHFIQGMFSSGLYTAIEFWISGSLVYLATTYPNELAHRNRLRQSVGVVPQ